jgi:hypothetical protein
MCRTLKPHGCAFIAVPNRFQLRDEHNYVTLGTWIPTNLLRRKYVEKISKNKGYVQCWERSGLGWKRIFDSLNLHVDIRPIDKFSRWKPTCRFHLYIRKL